MKVCLTLICLFFLTLQDGDAAGTHAEKEGGNITVGCTFSFSGSPMYFCKENCEGENILIETKENTAQKGRYSIEWVKNDFMSYVLYVSISELKRSDSGRYRCGLGSIARRYEDFYLDVTEASNSLEPNWTLETFTATFLSSTSVTTAATLTQRLISSSSTTIQQTTILSEPNGETFLLFYLGLGLAVLIVLLATVLLIYCQRKRFHQQKGRPAETNPTDLTINTIYEEIREEDRENKPPAGEISSVYVYVQPDKPNAAESNEIYSLASEPQGQAKDGEAEYSEVQLLNDDTGSNGGHLGVSDNVTCSEPQLDMSSGSHGNSSNPLYSSITLEQELC
ncbi:uncharacterized protein LOC111611618 isoform X2 [Xiphophorus maculatus]|uniref:uncharacterized protein LOC111611618 isoform X2 n=1 Tax=Xiphophorus maculatus TaxID=8083 RepID=UPI000C6E983E|nr:uncharacterized protein LOC111611618 isoform X2 [Xiphophorus maculatus]